MRVGIFIKKGEIFSESSGLREVLEMHLHREGGTMLLYALMFYPLEFYVMLWNEVERQAEVTIPSAFQVLTEIQNILTDHSDRMNSLLVDASNRFFTLVPHVHPRIISDQDALKSKVFI